MKQPLMFSVLCAGVISIAGCSSSQVNPEQYSGFLKDYSRLSAQKSPSGADVMRWVDPNLKVSSYTSIYIEPSQFYPKPEPTTRIPASTLQGITRYYDQALKREISKALPLADGPGPGVIVVRPAITAVSSSAEGLKVYEVIPVALVYAAASTAAGTRDENSNIATLDNDKQVLTADDVKVVLDGWASDMLQSYLKLKAQ
jgi:hypothetical protein